MSIDNDDNIVTGVTTIGENDIVCGRGGAALKHPGNLAYRKIVNINKTLYATCLKAEKLRISKSIVAAIREVNGRFLEREDGKISTTLDEKNPDGTSVTWKDIGDKRAIEKTSQALREGQPKLLKWLKQQGVDPEHAAAAGNFGMMNGVNYQVLNGVHDQNGVNDAQASMPPLPQMHVPEHNQVNYHYGETLPFDPNNGYAGANPPVLKQDSFQQMIGETFNNRESAQGIKNEDPFSGHISMAQKADCDSLLSDSWAADPTPLPFHGHSNITMGKDDSSYLLNCLDMGSIMRSSVNSYSVASGSQSGSGSQQSNSRPRQSVTFKSGRDSLKSGRDSLMSLGSHFSELSTWDTQSLDSAMDQAEREADLQLLGDEELDFDWGNTYYEHNLAGDRSNDGEGQQRSSFRAPIGIAFKRTSIGPAQQQQQGGDAFMRGSILKRTPRFSIYSQNAFPAAALTESTSTDPGMLFTSTFDAKPGGVNAGTDISGLIGDRRKSAVAFESRADSNRRRMSSMRLSNASMISDFGAFRRDFGSTMSIQTADIRHLLDMEMEEESDEDDV